MAQLQDPLVFLQTIHQAFWRGQSYQEMYDELCKLLLAKSFAERHKLRFRVQSFPKIWEATSLYCRKIGIEVSDPLSYPDDRLDRAIDLLEAADISGNSQLWHILHRVWLAHSVKREHGQYFTPQFIKRFMVGIYRPEPHMTVCDPCGGSAGFVVEAADQMDDFEPGNLFYYDIDAGPVITAARIVLALYSHPATGKGLSRINVRRRDSLAGPFDRPMDRIFTNVPFGIRLNRRATYTREGDSTPVPIIDDYQTGLGKTSELSQILFIEQCLRNLAPDGKFATVVDKGVVTNASLMKERAALAAMGHLELVVQLPANAFEYSAGTTFPTFLLFFSKSPVVSTSFGYVGRLGYNKDGYDFGQNHLEEAVWEDFCWERSDWPKVLEDFRAGRLSSVAVEETRSGNWHGGIYRYRDWSGRRLADVARLVHKPWDGANTLTPTVDRTYRVLTRSHLCPAKRVRTLEAGTLFMSRLVAEDSPPACGVTTEEFVGAGCTGEGCVLKPLDQKDLVLLWYLINFDTETHTYLRSNARGQGRGRVLADDLMAMPIPDVDESKLKLASKVLAKLLKKSEIDRLLTGELESLGV